MNRSTATRRWYHFLLLRGMSIQQRLPLLICLLLLIVILTFGLASYYSVRNAAMEVGKKRLRSATEQVSAMLGQSIKSSSVTTQAVIQKDSLRKFLQSRDPQLQDAMLATIKKLRKDSTWVYVELVDANRNSILRSNDPIMELNISLKTILPQTNTGRDSIWLGKIFRVKDSMYYPFIARATDKNKVLGYLVSWHVLYSSQKNMDQLSQLMGPGIALFIGNMDGSFWTNMTKPVSHPPVDKQNTQDFFNYKDAAGIRHIGAAQPLQNTSWLLVIELPENIVMESAVRFRNWVFLVGGIIILAGILLAWLMSRNITRPLNKLTAAASSVAAGDYSMDVEVDRNDELGKLAQAFNTMAVQVKNAQAILEKKVTERTEALETANNELEAFSYSVSHDLRAPLRGIIGFTSILEEEHCKELSDEAKRLTSIIKANTLKMGMLIDDLLSFSRMARQDIAKISFDTNILLKEIVKEVAAKNNKPIDWAIETLPTTQADPNAMRQVWVNLLSNAVKYSSKTEAPRIEIGSFIKEGQIVFYVKDNGVGFDQKYSAKLFKVFQRLHSVYEFEGTGVGLAIVEKIIAKHDGKVWAESEKGKGASFYFSLPQ